MTVSMKSNIKEVLNDVRHSSYTEKKSSYMDVNKVNRLLDSINDFKNDLKEKTVRIYNVNENMDKLTWFNIDDLNEDCLMALNDLISSAKDLQSSLIRQYVVINKILKVKGIAKEEIKDFKNSIDELKESYEDLESVFFSLPQMPEFVETTKQLSLI